MALSVRIVSRAIGCARVLLQMQGPCLYPFIVEKQTALRMVLEDLLINAGFARRLWIHQAWAHPHACSLALCSYRLVLKYVILFPVCLKYLLSPSCTQLSLVQPRISIDQENQYIRRILFVCLLLKVFLFVVLLSFM